MSEGRVRDALAAIGAEVEEAPDLWERTQKRVVTRRRRRRATAVIAAALSVALVVAVVSVVVRDDGGAPLTAGAPSAAIPDEIVAVVDGNVVVLSSEDGSVVRSLVEGDPGFPTEVSAAADADVLVYTRRGAPQPGCTDDSRELVGPTGSIVTSAGPLLPAVSPDGAYVAYRISECDAASAIGVTELATGTNFQVRPPSAVGVESAPLAWRPDSASLLVRFGDKLEIVSAPLGQDRYRVLLPAVSRLAFLSADEVAVSDPQTGVLSVELWNVRTGDHEPLVGVDDGQVLGLSFDADSRALLVATDTTLQWLPIDGGEPTTIGELPGLTAAVWAPAELRLPSVEPPPVPETVVLPNVLGLDADEAVETLEALGLEVAVEGDGPRVVEMSSAPGTPVLAGSTVTVVLGTLGGEPGPVPDVRGRSVADAFDVLARAGFTSEVADDSAATDPAGATVIWQEPPPGATSPGFDRHGVVYLWSCPASEQCVVPPTDFVDGFEPAQPWRTVDLAEEPFAEVAATSWASPGDLAAAVEASLREGFDLFETVRSTVTSETAADAEVWVQVRDLPDDSAAGWDYRLRLRSDADGWTLVAVDARVVCTRGSGIAELCL